MKESIYELREYANMLSEGIDPTSGLEFREDTILNNPKIKKYNKRVKEILDRFVLFIDTGNKRTNRKIDFFLTKQMESRISLSEEPISVSKLCYRINDVVPEGMKKLRASQITNKLVESNVLKVVEYGDYGEVKVPTRTGIELGLVLEEQINKQGNSYIIIKYSIKAQHYVLENIVPRFDW